MVSSSECALAAGELLLHGAVGRDASVSAPSRHDHDEVRFRFPRSCRLTARKQYLVVYGRGRRIPSRSLTLFGLPNSLDTCRLGITVTRKVGSAVYRNRIKRMLRDVFRRRKSELSVDLDLVVNAHRGFCDRSLAEIEQEFMTTFSRLTRNLAQGSKRG
jgi:ribonuclease P protein component